MRERPEDIPLLAGHFATRMTAELGGPYFAGFTPPAIAALLAHPWPGNVRELRNATERSVCRLARPDRQVDTVVIDPFPRPANLPPSQEPPMEAPAEGFHAKIKRQEAQLLQQALTAARFNQRRAADSLGLSYDQFRRLLRAHRLMRSRELGTSDRTV